MIEIKNLNSVEGLLLSFAKDYSKERSQPKILSGDAQSE